MIDIKNGVNVAVVDVIEKEFSGRYHITPIKLQINEETRELTGSILVDDMATPDSTVEEVHISKKLDDLTLKDPAVFDDPNLKISILISVSKDLDNGTPIPGSTYLKVHRHVRKVELIDMYELGQMYYGYKMHSDSKKIKLTDTMFTTLAADLSSVYLVGESIDGEYVVLYSTMNIGSPDLIKIANDLKGEEVTCLVTDKIDHVIYKNTRKLIGPIITTELVRVM